MGVSKVVYGSDTLIDLTADTVTADKLLEGITAHGADGEAITGTYSPSSETAYSLWENPNPNTNFNSGTKELMAPISSNGVPLYKKMKIQYKRTSTGSAVYETTFVLPDDLNDYKKDANKQAFVYGYETSDYYSCRYIQYVDDFSLWVSTGYRSNTSAGISTHNVIVKIYGIT